MKALFKFLFSVFVPEPEESDKKSLSSYRKFRHEKMKQTSDFVGALLRTAVLMMVVGYLLSLAESSATTWGWFEAISFWAIFLFFSAVTLKLILSISQVITAGLLPANPFRDGTSIEIENEKTQTRPIENLILVASAISLAIAVLLFVLILFVFVYHLGSQLYELSPL